MFAKKSQVQNLETIFVLIVVVFLLALFTINYFKLEGHKVKMQQQRFLNLDMIEILQYISYSPYFNCGLTYLNSASCIDYYKATSFSYLAINDDGLSLYLSRLIGKGKLTLIIKYPSDKQEEIELYNTLANENYDTIKFAYLPVNVYYSVEGLVGYGILLLEVAY